MTSIMAQFIYVVSSHEYSRVNVYKVGRHKGSPAQLRRRYVSAMPAYRRYLFVECKDCASVERDIKQILRPYRLANDNNRLSEWTQIDLATLYCIIGGVIESKNTADRAPHYARGDCKEDARL